jgi:pimeloyl-ACP methyl ester carboxylesterase
VLPQVQVVEFNGMGHMGPITHPQVVNEAISRFLDEATPSFERTADDGC